MLKGLAERGGEKTVVLLVFHQAELPQRRHINHPPGEFANGQEFIDLVQDLSLTGFLGISLGVGIKVLHIPIVPDFL